MSDEDLSRESERIAALLDETRAMAGPLTWQRVDELIHRVIHLYGAGMASLVDIARSTARSPRILEDTIEADELVSSLLIVHGAHPISTRRRVERAIADALATTPGATDIQVEEIGIDQEDAVTLRLQNGSAAARRTLAAAVKRAIEARAPEIVRITIEGAATEERLYQITRKSS